MEPASGSDRLIATRRLRLVQSALFDAQGELGETYANPPLVRNHRIDVPEQGTFEGGRAMREIDWGSIADNRSRLKARVANLRRLRDREVKRVEAAGGSRWDIYMPKSMGLDIPTDSSHAGED